MKIAKTYYQKYADKCGKLFLELANTRDLHRTQKINKRLESAKRVRSIWGKLSKYESSINSFVFRAQQLLNLKLQFRRYRIKKLVQRKRINDLELAFDTLQKTYEVFDYDIVCMNVKDVIKAKNRLNDTIIWSEEYDAKKELGYL